MGTLRALIVDYGGVLTNPLSEALAGWLRTDGVDAARFRSLMRQWSAEDADGSAGQGRLVHDLEAGRIDPREFERLFAARLAASDGSGPAAAGLLARMFAGFRAEAGMAEVLRAARRAGLRTALLSNSWGLDYPRDGWADLFDATVISGEVGMRKPDPEIYLHTAARLGVAPADCVFVDDLRPNVRGAVRVGMVGVHHTDVATTVEELEILFGVPLAGP